MKINILKLDTTVEVNSAATIVLSFNVSNYPNYTKLYSHVSAGKFTVIQNENYIILRVNNFPDTVEEITGTVYIYYTTETSVQEYVEFVDHSSCIEQIGIDNFILSGVSLVDRVSPYGKVLTYTVAFKELENTYEITTILLPEDAYLVTPDKTMRIKYNPEISNLKRNFVDVITPTLGRAYPFVRRAGKQKYKTFTLGGLISIEAETQDAPWGVDSTNNSGEAGAHTDGRSLLTEADREVLDKIDTMQLSTYDARAVKEKLYRERILDFLEDGRIKLFKSVQEGNIFIYISGVTLTSDKSSGRNLYSFSCTATEVAPQYEDYDVYSIILLNQEE